MKKNIIIIILSILILNMIVYKLIERDKIQDVKDYIKTLQTYGTCQ